MLWLAELCSKDNIAKARYYTVHEKCKRALLNLIFKRQKERDFHYNMPTFFFFRVRYLLWHTRWTLKLLSSALVNEQQIIAVEIMFTSWFLVLRFETTLWQDRVSEVTNLKIIHDKNIINKQIHNIGSFWGMIMAYYWIVVCLRFKMRTHNHLNRN